MNVRMSGLYEFFRFFEGFVFTRCAVFNSGLESRYQASLVYVSLSLVSAIHFSFITLELALRTSTMTCTET